MTCQYWRLAYVVDQFDWLGAKVLLRRGGMISERRVGHPVSPPSTPVSTVTAVALLLSLAGPHYLISGFCVHVKSKQDGFHDLG